MSRERKYVIQNEVFPFICSAGTQHSDLCRYGGTSAGFFSIRPHPTRMQNEYSLTPYLEVECWGESISLKLKSNPEKDKVILERLFNAD